MLNDLRRFSSSAFPVELRQSAWNEAFQRVRLASTPAGCATTPADGHVTLYSSPLDSVFLQVSAASQVLSPHPDNARLCQGSTVLVLALLSGSGALVEGGQSVAIGSGDIVLFDPAQAWRIELNSDFRALLVKLESASFILRLVRTGRQELNRIATRSGVGAVCLNLIQSIADELAHLDRDELPALEATLTDLLVAGLSNCERSQPEDSTSVQLAHLRRVCRCIEARLGDARLQVEDVARLEGLSVRYLQKLFRASGATFGSYLRNRRLERCRVDLANPALVHYSISELCFRWGFGDAANFSRAFSAQFGLSPRAYRAESPEIPHETLQRGRPPRSQRLNLVPPRAGNDAVDGQRRAFQGELNDHARYALSLALAPKRSATAAGRDSEAGVVGETLPSHYYIPVSEKTVHWGYFSRSIAPVLTVSSGDTLTIETLTQHASDDCERMIEGDPGAESVFHWSAEKKSVERRGAGPMDASIFGRGAGEGFGVHICTGPVHVRGAEPGDVLEVRILDILPRPSCHPQHHGRSFGSNAAAWWGFHYDDMLTEPKKREVVTVYEIDWLSHPPHAKALYNFRWTPQTDPFGVRHVTIDYPGVPVDPASVERQYGVLAKAVVPVRPHFGVLAVAPKEIGPVDSIPPSYFGGNLDNWRAGKGAKVFLPVSVDGALFSVGDPHASQGDSELCGTAIECSLTGVFQLVLHKKARMADSFLAELSYPFLETAEEWVLQGLSFANYQAELGPNAQTQVYKESSMEAAMRDAFRKTRHYLMKAHGLNEDEAISLMSVAVDFGVTQVVDGNLGVHAVIRKAIFPGYNGVPTQPVP